MTILFITFALVFALLQGAAVVGTAAAALKAIGLHHWAFKIVFVVLSYIAWFVAAFVIWGFIGGGFGIMDGGMPLFFMSVTSIFGSFFVGIIWLIASIRSGVRANG